MALDPADEQYDTLYDDLQGLVRDIAVNISNYDENIYKKELAIANATSKQVTAEDVFKYMKALVECFDYLPEEDEQKIMNGILDAVELHEKKQPNGMWVKKIRFKVPLKFPDGSVYDEVEFIDEDSLPNVNHDETVVCLFQQKPDDHIEIEIDLDEINPTYVGWPLWLFCTPIGTRQGLCKRNVTFEHLKCGKTWNRQDARYLR